MKTDLNEAAEKYKQEIPERFMDILIEEKYPEIFKKLDKIRSEIRQLESEPDKRLEMLAEKIYDQIKTIYDKEKLVLFPYIHSLIKEKKKSETCAVFKDVKQHYTAVIAALTEIKEFLLSRTDKEQTQSVEKDILEFEKNIRVLQFAKDRYLFAQFKTCSGCRIVSEN